MPGNPFLTIGYYNAFHTKCLKHAFAQMKQKDIESLQDEIIANFQCYGSVTGEDQHDDVGFCLPQIKPRVDLNRAKLDVNSFAARSLAMLKMADDMSRMNYDRKRGGFFGLGDCSGIVYGITGVCHQMCNVVTIATGELTNPEQAPINYPPSFQTSYAIYGLRGKITSHIYAFAGLLAENLSGTAPGKNFQENYDEILKQFIADLKHFLQNGEPEEARANRYRTLAKTCGTEKIIANLLETDNIFHKVKKEADVQLIRGELAGEEYGDTLNGVYHIMMNEFANVLGPANFRQAFGHDPKGAESSKIIEVDLMPPSYEELRQALNM